jgi:hypothetical protein
MKEDVSRNGVIDMFVVAFTNQVSENDFLFFSEFDNAEEFDVLEEANYLAQIGEIDIDVNISSPRCYHLISFDILTREQVVRLQRYITLEVGHYLDLDEILLYRATAEACRLRLGEKFDKPSPKFFRRFMHNKGHKKSLQHFKLAQFYYDTPDYYPLPNKLYKVYELTNPKFLNLKARICIYKTGIGIKKFAHFEDPRLRRLEIKRCENKQRF